MFAALACAAVVGAIVLLRPQFRKPAQPDWVQVGFRRGTVWSGNFSSDGQTIVYSAAWDGDPVRLFSTRPGSTETRMLDLPPGKLLAISKKSEIAFLRDVAFNHFFFQPGILARAGLEAGVGRDILENVQAADWSPDGTELAVAREFQGNVRLEYPIGKKLYETDRPISNMRISRDGAWIAFCEGGGEVSVSALRVSDGQRRVLSEGWFPGATGLAWSADGKEIWFTPQKKVRDSSPPILAVSLSGKVREVVRAPGQLRLYDIAPDGRVLLARWDLQLGVRAASPSDGVERELAATDDSLLSDLSSDGRAVLFYDRYAAYLRGTDGSPPLRLGEAWPDGRLSPDGKWLLTVSTEEGSSATLIPVGAGEVRQIGTQECHSVEWYPDGKRILCEVTDTGKGFASSPWNCRPARPLRSRSRTMRRRISTTEGRSHPTGLLRRCRARRRLLDRAARGRGVSSHRRSRASSPGRCPSVGAPTAEGCSSSAKTAPPGFGSSISRPDASSPGRSSPSTIWPASFASAR